MIPPPKDPPAPFEGGGIVIGGSMLKSLINVSAERMKFAAGDAIAFTVKATPAGKVLVGDFAVNAVIDKKAADKLAYALELAAEKLRRA